MMRQHESKFLEQFTVIGSRRLLATCLAMALVAVFTTERANGQLLHLWDFNAGSELADSAGSLDLNFAPGEGGVTVDDGGTPEDPSDDTIIMGTAGDVSFEPGFNGIGQAYRPFYVDPAVSSTAGAGLTGSGFTSPNQFTIETIVKGGTKTSASAVNYIFQTRPGSDRGYYLTQDESGLTRGDVNALGSVVGQSFGDIAHGLLYDESSPWLYIAAVIDLTGSPGQAVADIYAANLSAGETTPTLVLDNRAWATTNPSSLAGATGIFGIGNFSIDRDGDTIAEASQEWFQGAIDYVAVYDGLLGQEALGANLAARFVPEPSSLALVGILGCVLGFVRRRS